MLIPFPFAYLFGSAALSLTGRLVPRGSIHQTASHLSALGIAAGVVAAVPGVVDYLLSVPPDSSAARRATRHGVANISAMFLFLIARSGRARPDAAATRWAVTLELCGAALLSYSGWLGGTLVYRNQIGVDHRYANAGRWRLAEARADGITAGTIDVGSADGFTVDQMSLVRVGDRRIVLARTADGWAAFDDRCTHRGGPLSDGALVCGTVQCPWHGSQFSVTTGAVVNGPAETPIHTYPVVERERRLYLTLP